MTGRRSNFLVKSLFGCALSLAVCWSALAFAQFDLLSDLKSGGPTPKAEIAVTLTPADVKPGDEVTLTVNVKLPEGFYIYSTSGEFDGRTRIVTNATGLEPIDNDFIADREPKTQFEPLLEATVSKFHDHVTWKKRYRVLQDSNPATVSVKGELTGQYCSEGSEEMPGKCIPIIPAYEFDVAATVQSAPVRFDYEVRPAPKKSKTNPALLKFKLSPEDAKPGDAVTLSITMELDAGWHTFSLSQKGDGGNPTDIELLDFNGLTPTGDFQPDHPFEVEGELKLEVHHDRVTWSRPMQVLDGIAPGQYGIKGRISYQTCKSICLPLRKVEFTLGHILARATPPEVADVPPKPGQVGLPAGGPPADQLENPAKKPVQAVPALMRPQDQGLFRFLMTAIGFGLVSLLTPCVFPMVPITVSFFLKQSESEHHSPLMMAFVFCGSIVATFTVLGVGIAALFGAAQLNALANNPWLNIGIGLVFVMFALNMLGLFEIRIPSSLLTFTANKEQAGGYIGAVFMALTFTLTSFTCTFAFAGTLLVAASQGQFYWPIIGMMAFGAAFALPFFVLAMIPSLLKKLPKSGGWMNVVKVVMGLIEVGAAVKFFSVADMVWNPTPVLFDFSFVMISWMVLSAAISMYLFGIFRLSHDVLPSGISVGRLMLSMAFLGLAVQLGIGIFLYEKADGWIINQILALAPPRFELPEPVKGGGGGRPTELPDPVVVHHGIWFTLDVDKGIEHAKQLKRPLMLDFTGVNCANCRLMEKKMAQPNNSSRLERFVLVQLYTDKVPTISDPVEVKRLMVRNIDLQEKWFGEVTLPSYAVVTPDGKQILSTYSGNEQREGEFAEFLDAGWQKWEEMKPKGGAVEVVKNDAKLH